MGEKLFNNVGVVSLIVFILKIKSYANFETNSSVHCYNYSSEQEIESRYAFVIIVDKLLSNTDFEYFQLNKTLIKITIKRIV